jgi:hypothetical protein
MFGAGFEHVYLVVLQDHLSLNDFQAPWTKAIGEIVVDIRAIMTCRINSLYILFEWWRN